MKKLLIILITIPLIFNSCKKEEVEEVLPCLCETNGIGSVEYLSNDSSETINVFIPNSFTPNGDQHNDNFSISINHVVTDSMNQWNNPVMENISYNLFIDGNQVVFDNPINGNNSHWSGLGYSNGEYSYLITFNFNGLTYQKNGKVSIIKLYISDLSNTFICFPEGLSKCTFGDMIDPQYGFIYSTQENLNNW
jgi:hypothetical protein|tara:strand:- start:142 stop:720 length:579 start_codon:yes stop_codon:yes gene_type:complete